MIRKASVLIFAALLAPFCMHGQENEPGPHKFYHTGSSEAIFSFPVLDVGGNDKGGIVRFSAFFNAQWMVNYDPGKHFGLFSGLSIRNQGFIYHAPDTTVWHKYRTYNLGIPIGFKLGHMNHALMYAGYELELPFNYKEKRFENERKEDKFNVWFSDRTEKLFHSVFVGFQGPRGTNLTVRYYLTNFHNKDYEESRDGHPFKPYAGLNANVVAISLGFGLFDGRTDTSKDPRKEPMDIQAQRW